MAVNLSKDHPSKVMEAIRASLNGLRTAVLAHSHTQTSNAAILELQTLLNKTITRYNAHKHVTHVALLSTVLSADPTSAVVVASQQVASQAVASPGVNVNTISITTTAVDQINIRH